MERGRRRKISLHLDADQVEWLEERARRGSTSVSTVLRQVVRAAMDAEAPMGGERVTGPDLPPMAG